LEVPYNLACTKNQVIVTMDKDFTKTFRFSPVSCGGIIVVKIYKRTIDETSGIFKKYYINIKGKDIIKNLVIITPEGVRIRRSQTGRKV
ncbi:MAG: DUF5615 family PIN-like protein, partial [Thermodesulfobacteriota bacterium]